jgi:hypothetical protein
MGKSILPEAKSTWISELPIWIGREVAISKPRSGWLRARGAKDERKSTLRSARDEVPVMGFVSRRIIEVLGSSAG